MSSSAEVENKPSTENGEAQPESAEQPASTETKKEETKEEGKKTHPTGRTVIIKNLPVGMLFTYNEELREKFGKYGDIGYVKLGGVPIDHSTVTPTLSAFVNFNSPESSDKALAEENGSEMHGNRIELQILRSGEHTVVANNIPFVISEDCLRNIFAPCGEITRIVKIPARPTAFIEFLSEESVTKALSLNGSFSINNAEVTITKQGVDQAKTEQAKNKAKLAKLKNKANRATRVFSTPRGGGMNSGGRGTVRGGRGGMGSRGSGPRGGSGGSRGGRGGMGGGGSGGGNSWSQGGMGGGWGGNYGPWEGAPSRQYSSWGNDNYSNNNDGPRGFKRRKQNDWWQY